MVVIQGEYEKIIRMIEKQTTDYFEFVFSYVDSNEKFRELDRFLWEARHCLRFKNEYEGNVVIDLSGWNDKTKYEFNEYFNAFMFYLKSRKDTLHVTFILDGACSAALYEQLSRHYEIHLCEPDKGEVPLTVQNTTLGFGGRE